MKDNFNLIRNDFFPADGVSFWQKVEDFVGIGTGRRKACSEAGLSGAEKRACARQLKSSGWKKGQPIPATMAGITQKDVVEAEKYPPLPTEIYVPPYQATAMTPTSVETDNMIEDKYPQNPYPATPPVNTNKPSLDVPDRGMFGMNPTEQIITVLGVTAFVVVAGFGIKRMLKNKTAYNGMPKMMATNLN